MAAVTSGIHSGRNTLDRGTMKGETKDVPERTLERLTLYRRLLNVLYMEGVRYVYSRELAEMAGRTPAQVRRDLMAVGFTGNPAHGYRVDGLIKSMRRFLDKPGGQNVALVGAGNLGKALLAYFEGRRPNLRIVAVFDSDPNKVNRLIGGCRCYSPDRMAQVVKAKDVQVAVIAVPASSAQQVADRLVASGVRGILNFAPALLRVPQGVYVEDLDMTTALEKVAYFSRRRRAAKGSDS